MRPGAPTRLDRAVLALVSGPLGHLVGTALEVGPTVAGILARRVRARLTGRRGA
ncbi:hypothetical protein [Patulibacter sp.]|uniref:hypothetical protein n=1 Tax=Patulibacter sp. TaxID=1912859 RepID=UPI00271975EC|nr:hypothetical protein [Patulibacter sp.]MDO9408446.1 hypothetical protein [Patulibacter sp.]